MRVERTGKVLPVKAEISDRRSRDIIRWLKQVKFVERNLSQSVFSLIRLQEEFEITKIDSNGTLQLEGAPLLVHRGTYDKAKLNRIKSVFFLPTFLINKFSLGVNFPISIIQSVKSPVEHPMKNHIEHLCTKGEKSSERRFDFCSNKESSNCVLTPIF